MDEDLDPARSRVKEWVDERAARRAQYPLREQYDLADWAHPYSDVAPPGLNPKIIDPLTARPLLSWRLSFWLAEIRWQARLTQAELAAAMETTQPALSKWERGRTLISLDTLGKLGENARIPIALYAELPIGKKDRVIWL